MTMLETPVGRSSVFDSDAVLTYRNEADLRDGIAALAWLNGWDVATEVKVPTGGRADLILTSPTGLIVCVELKVKLNTQRQFRFGFQQADGYKRHFERVSRAGCIGILAAAEIDDEVGEPVSVLYPSIWLYGVGSLMRLVRVGFDAMYDEAAAREAVMVDRQKQAVALASFATSEADQRHVRRRDNHLRDLSRNYPAMALTLRRELAA